jgi:hypothetical protein
LSLDPTAVRRQVESPIVVVCSISFHGIVKHGWKQLSVEKEGGGLHSCASHDQTKSE